MSRRANILLLLALAAGVAYGWFGVPSLLPFADGIDATAEEPEGQVLSEADQIRFRMQSLILGMDNDEAGRVLFLHNMPASIRVLERSSWYRLFNIDKSHTLLLQYAWNGGLVAAELFDGEQAVARFPTATMIKRNSGG